MVTPMFGWSAGDVVNSIHIIIKICEAFKEAGGAASRYEESLAFLEGLKATLSKVDAHIHRNPNPEHAAEITQQLKLIDAPYSRFEKFMLDFQPALSPTSSYGNVRKVPTKIKWALKELSAVSGKVAELKKEVCDPLILLENLMQLQSLNFLQNIDAQISKLPESTHIETLMNTLKDTAVDILIETQSHIRDLNQSVQRHEQELTRFGELLSNWKTSLVTFANEESEKGRQLQATESVKFVKHVDNVSAILKKKLDAVTDVLEEQEQSHVVRHESLVESVRSQQLALDQVHRSVEAFAAKAVDLVVLLDQKMSKTESHDESNPRNTWLSQFITQLISSGITSAITGAVVLVSVRSKLDRSSKSNGCAGTAHQPITAAPKEKAEDEAPANISKTASDQNDLSKDAIEVTSIPIRPQTAPSASALQSSPSQKAGPKQPSKSSDDDKSNLSDTCTLNGTARSSRSTRTGDFNEWESILNVPGFPSVSTYCPLEVINNKSNYNISTNYTSTNNPLSLKSSSSSIASRTHGFVGARRRVKNRERLPPGKNVSFALPLRLEDREFLAGLKRHKPQHPPPGAENAKE